VSDTFAWRDTHSPREHGVRHQRRDRIFAVQPLVDVAKHAATALTGV
jgi:hypothetical protein